MSSPGSYVSQVVRKADRLVLPAAPWRRTGSEKRYAESLEYVQRDIDWLAGQLVADDLPDSASYAYEFSLELTSLFYAAGADRDIWQAWSSLASVGSAIRGNVLDAAAYTVLSGRFRKGRIFENASTRTGCPGRDPVATYC